jgi:hypothetical protein
MSIGAAPGTERSTAPGFLADLIRNGVALFSAGAAGIHFAVTQVHFEEWWLFGAFFLALAWFQTLWAILVVASPHRLVFLLGALANGATVALWTVTRTAGIPIGPNAGVPEEIETVDLLSTVFEIMVVLGCVLLLTRGPTSRYLGGRRVVAGTLALGLVVVSLTSGAVAAWEPHPVEEQGGGEEPGHTEEAQDEQQQEPEVHTISLSGRRSVQAFVDPGTPGRRDAICVSCSSGTDEMWGVRDSNPATWV